MQVGGEEGGRPAEGEAAPGGGAGGRVPEDARRLRPAGAHQPGAAQEGAVRSRGQCARASGPRHQPSPLCPGLTPPDTSQSPPEWARVAGVPRGRCALLR